MPSVDGSATDAGVTVTFKVTRKVDAVALQNDWHTCPNPSSRRSRKTQRTPATSRTGRLT